MCTRPVESYITVLKEKERILEVQRIYLWYKWEEYGSREWAETLTILIAIPCALNAGLSTVFLPTDKEKHLLKCFRLSASWYSRPTTWQSTNWLTSTQPSWVTKSTSYQLKMISTLFWLFFCLNCERFHLVAHLLGLLICIHVGLCS